MTDDQRKHLELIQAVVNRLASNSFSLKGWCVTLVAAVFALASKDPYPWFFAVGLVPVLTFWGLDAYYLWQERLFRALYDKFCDQYVPRTPPVSTLTGNLPEMSMDTRPLMPLVQSEKQTLLSRTIDGFYVPLFLAVLIVTGVAWIVWINKAAALAPMPPAKAEQKDLALHVCYGPAAGPWIFMDSNRAARSRGPWA